tara:strand:- start:6530 stop:6784 length:255 start_codon:yes stop_codon:yes gene_type:complete
MKIINAIIDTFGWNDWKYLNLREPHGDWEWDTSFHEYRICRVTGKFQMASPHCFGMNPPEYKMYWKTLETKPKLRYIGREWRVM